MIDRPAGSDARAWRLWVGLAVLTVGLIAGHAFLPAQQWVESVRAWLQGLGALAWLAFVAIYAIGTILLLPGTLLTLAGGLAFGLWAFPMVVAGATLGAAIAFLAGRFLLRDRVAAGIGRSRRLRALDAAIAEEGWQVVGLLRLSPAMPFSLQNWVLGATRVGFVPYLTATFFGIMPGTLLYVWVASLGAGDIGGPVKWTILALGLVTTLAVTVLVARKARARLADRGLTRG